MSRIYSIPFSKTSTIHFDYAGETFSVSAPRWNKAVGAFFVDVGWSGGSVKGVCLTVGNNILLPFNTPMPNIFVYSKKNNVGEVTGLSDLSMYILGEIE